MSDKIREAFDAWRSSKGWQRPDDLGEWEAWQAALARRPASAAVPDGWKLVPINLTAEMIDRAWREPEFGHNNDIERMWAGALSAAPAAPPAAKQPECGCCGQTGPCDPDCDCAEQPVAQEPAVHACRGCVACEGNPAGSNNPCHVCGGNVPAARRPAASVQWIPVSERLPEIDQYVLLCTEFGGKAGDWRYSIGALDRSLLNDPIRGPWFVKGASWKPSHWMLLPAAPGDTATPAAEQPEAPGLPELLIALGCAGIAVSGGTHGDPWRITLPTAEQPDTMPVPRHTAEGALALIETHVPFPTSAGFELRALLGKESV